MDAERARAPRGAVEDTGPAGKYLVIKHHSICEESKKPKDGFMQIEVANPRTGDVTIKYIKKYRMIEGYIDEVKWYDTGDKYDQQYTGFKLKIVADQVYFLDLPFESRACTRFMQLAEHIDFTDFVTFYAWKTTNKNTGNEETAIAFKQNDQNIPQVYSKDKPGECPIPTKTTVAGKTKWNFDATNAFLFERMQEIVAPLAKQCAEARTPSTAQRAEPELEFSGPPIVDNDDDIPF